VPKTQTVTPASSGAPPGPLTVPRISEARAAAVAGPAEANAAIPPTAAKITNNLADFTPRIDPPGQLCCAKNP
jgi:hypothetical protein